MSSEFTHEFISDAEILEETSTKSKSDKKEVKVEDAIEINGYDPYDFIRYFSILGF